jgi:hypothetical protein
MKTRITVCVALLIVAVSAWIALMFKRAADTALDASNRGHAYRNFFGVLEMYTAQTGAFPSSVDDMLIIETELGYEGVRWPQDARLLIELIQPNFDIIPAADNLSSFAPDYRSNAGWATLDCEFYWGQILDDLNTAP